MGALWDREHVQVLGCGAVALAFDFSRRRRLLHCCQKWDSTPSGPERNGVNSSTGLSLVCEDRAERTVGGSVSGVWLEDGW